MEAIPGDQVLEEIREAKAVVEALLRALEDYEKAVQAEMTATAEPQTSARPSPAPVPQRTAHSPRPTPTPASAG
jgi:hypothetical protein